MKELLCILLKITDKSFSFLAKKDELEKIVKDLTNLLLKKKDFLLILPLEGDNSNFSFERFTFLEKKDELEKIAKNLTNLLLKKKDFLILLLEGDNSLPKKNEQEKCEKALEGIKEKGNNKSEFYNYLEKLNCVITIEDLFEKLERKYNITFSSEEKRNIILKLDKPKK